MLFWRTKSVKSNSDKPAVDDSATADTPVSENDEAGTSGEVATRVADADSSDEKATSEDADEIASAMAVSPSEPVLADAVIAETKLVTLTPVSRLSERLAGVFGATPENAEQAEPDADIEPVTAGKPAQLDIIAPATTANAPGQAAALAELRAALATPGASAHVLVLGAPGTGRKASAEVIAQELAQAFAQPDDWIYAPDHRESGALKPVSVPAGSAERLVRDIREAFTKSSAMLARIVASDHHQMALTVLDEDHRHRGEAPFDALKRRAEAQNIALVKTTEGYMVAPMHEGKVVRADVFRALPEALQRDVEAKVTALEIELQQVMGGLGGNDIATDDRHLALTQQAAERAVKPNIAVVRKLDAPQSQGLELLDMLEADWTRRAVDCVRRGADARTIALPLIATAISQRGTGAPVVVTQSVKSEDLLGEFGRDASGDVALRAGALMQANGGFLIIDAWRLAAEPAAWPALSSALEVGSVRPVTAPGLAVAAGALPLNVKLVLIAERDSFAKLQALDPRIAQHFGSVVRFADTATAFDVSEATFAEWVAALAKALAIRRLKSGAAAPLYDNARSRAGDRSRVSLDIASLVQALRVADALAADAGREVIAADDVERALKRRAALQSAEQTA